MRQVLYTDLSSIVVWTMVDTVVILAGGSGTRLWPLSSTTCPKQFTDIGTGKTLIRHSLDRARSLGNIPTMIVTHKDQAPRLRAELQDDTLHILEEPAALNTGPAIGLALAKILKEDPSASVLVLSSDHLIEPEAAFIASIEEADALARQGYIVTLGIPPRAPETGYGYIKKGSALAKEAWNIDAFTEKPSQDLAQAYCESSNYLWNSGMFLFSAKTMREEFHRHAPDIAHMLETLVTGKWQQIQKLYEHMEAISIDYAVMEKSDRCAVVSAKFSWSDVGSWDEIFRLAEEGSIADAKGSTYTLGTAPLYNEEAKSVLVQSDIPLALVGVEDLIVVIKNNQALIMKRGQSQKVKHIALRAAEAPHSHTTYS